MPNTPTYITIAEAADYLRVDPSTVRRYINTGRLPAYYVGPPGARARAVRIKLSDLQAIPERVTVAS